MNKWLTPLIKRQFRCLSKEKIFIHLASASPRRFDLLSLTGIPFKVVSSSYKETPLKISPQKIILTHALGKAKKSQNIKPKTKFRNIVLGADTIVCYRGKILGKPAHMKQAFKMLNFLCGKTHKVYTGLALYDFDNKRMWSGYSVTHVSLKALSHSQIQNYFQKISPLDKAGSYGIQSKPCIAQSWKGSFSSVIGLPLELLAKGLGEILNYSENGKPKSRKRLSRSKNS